MHAYPDSLPAPARWDATPRERRRSRSTLPGLPATRSRSRDRILDVSAEWVYTAAHMAVWRPWFDGTISLGLQWFEATLPGRGGWVTRIARYRPSTLRLDHIARGIYRVRIDLEVRGRT